MAGTISKKHGYRRSIIPDHLVRGVQHVDASSARRGFVVDNLDESATVDQCLADIRAAVGAQLASEQFVHPQAPYLPVSALVVEGLNGPDWGTAHVQYRRSRATPPIWCNPFEYAASRMFGWRNIVVPYKINPAASSGGPDIVPITESMNVPFNEFYGYIHARVPMIEYRVSTVLDHDPTTEVNTLLNRINSDAFTINGHEKAVNTLKFVSVDCQPVPSAPDVSWLVDYVFYWLGDNQPGWSDWWPQRFFFFGYWGESVTIPVRERNDGEAAFTGAFPVHCDETSSSSIIEPL